MKVFKRIASVVLSVVMMLSVVVPGSFVSAEGATEHHLLRPVDFADNLGTWTTNTADGAFESSALMGNQDWNHNTIPATATITVKNAGEYTLWVRAKEMTNATPGETPGAWTFYVQIGDTRIDTVFGGGDKSTTQFVWRNGGTINLEAGTYTISLLDPVPNSWARFDSVLLTNDSTLTPSEDYATLQQQLVVEEGGDEENNNGNYILMPYAFTTQGTWSVVVDTVAYNSTALGGKMSMRPGEGSDAVATLNNVEAGTYRIWIHGKEFPNTTERDTSWKFKAKVNGTLLDNTFGGGGKSLPAGTYVWEDGGTVTLNEGTNTISLVDEWCDYAKCDAIFITADLDCTPSAYTMDSLMEMSVVMGNITEKDAMEEFLITDDYAGGNIVVVNKMNNVVSLDNKIDPEEGSVPYFYWNFQATSDTARTVTFSFDQPKNYQTPIIGTNLKVLYSTDEGKTWEYMAASSTKAFSYTFKANETVRFCNVLPYVLSDYNDFVSANEDKSNVVFTTMSAEAAAMGIQSETVTFKTQEGREMPLVIIGNKNAKNCIVLTSRHHSCETIGSYTLEGMMQYFIDDVGADFLNKYCVYAVPFVDLDGVENGEQGKGRAGQDHNRDYGVGTYPEVTAITTFFTEVFKSKKPIVFLDSHAPGSVTTDLGNHLSYGNSDSNNPYGTQDLEIAMEVEVERFKPLLDEIENADTSADKLTYNTANAWRAYGTSNQSRVWFQKQGTQLATTIETSFTATPNNHYPENTARWGSQIAQAAKKYIDLYVVDDTDDEGVIDNDANGVIKNGPASNWVEYTDNAANGGSFLAGTGNGSDIVYFTWPLALEQAGYWTIEAYIPAAPAQLNVSNAVSYQINSAGGIKNVTIDQTKASGWVTIGTSRFSADGSETLTMTPPKGENTWAMADAIRATYHGETDPENPVVVVDNTDADTTITGTFPGTGWAGVSTYRSGYIGENYYSLRPGDSNASFTWKFKVPKTGYYEVSVHIPDGSSGGVSAGVSYEVYSDGNAKTASVSHNQPAGYYSLGKYYLEASDDAVAVVKLIDAGTTACMVDAAKIEYIGGTVEGEKGYYQIDLTDPQQTILGLGVEIQSDSLGSGNTMDANDTSGHSVPHDLTESERQRFYNQLMKGFRYVRLAGGLFYRGTDANEKHLTERWDTQDEELAEMLEVSGAEGFNLEFWSPTPYFKSNGQYHGGKLKCFDTSWEYYGNEAKTNEFLREFAQTLIEDFTRMKDSGLPIVQFSLQNEPPLTSVYGTYSFCYYTEEDYYRACKVVLPMLKEAFPELIIHAPSWNGQHAGASWLIKDDPEVLDCVDIWSWHTVGFNSDQMINKADEFNSATEGKPVINTEFEYQPGDFAGQYEYRFVNTTQAIMNWMVFENSPTWYWLHALKPLGNEESLGYSLGMWRKSGDKTQYSFSSAEQTEYWNSVEEKTWAYNYPNYNALRGFLEFMPWDSVRYTVAEDEVRTNQRIMAWKTPEGRLVFAVTNRDANEAFTFNVDTGLEDVSFTGYALTAYAEEMVELGKKTGSTIETTLDAYSVQFWVADTTEEKVSVVFKDHSGAILTELEVGAGAAISSTSIPTAPERYGYSFIGWSYDVEQVVFVDTVITALYEKNDELRYEITVNDGATITLPNGQTNCYYNDRVKVEAPEEKNGEKFSYWKANGGIFSYSNEISFLTFGDAEMEAVYGEEVTDKTVVFTDSNPTVTDKKNGKYDMHIMGVVSARGEDIEEIGILLAAGEYTAEEMTDGTAVTVKRVASKATNGRQFVYTVKNIPVGKARTAIVYAIIDGQTYYSDTSCIGFVETPVNGGYGGDQIIDEDIPDPFK